MRAERQGRSERSPKPLKARAIALLARREYSRAEIRARLVASGDESDAAQVDDVLDELVALGYLSDARFASAVVAQKSRGHGERAREGWIEPVIRSFAQHGFRAPRSAARAC